MRGKAVTLGHAPDGGARPSSSPALGRSATRPLRVTAVRGAEGDIGQVRARAGEGHPAAVEEQRGTPGTRERCQHLVSGAPLVGAVVQAGTGAPHRACRSRSRAGRPAPTAAAHRPGPPPARRRARSAAHSSWRCVPRCHCQKPRRTNARHAASASSAKASRIAVLRLTGTPDPAAAPARYTCSHALGHLAADSSVPGGDPGEPGFRPVPPRPRPGRGGLAQARACAHASASACRSRCSCCCSWRGTSGSSPRTPWAAQCPGPHP